MFVGDWGFGAVGYLAFIALAAGSLALGLWWWRWRGRARAAFGGLPAETRHARWLAIMAPALLIGAIAFAAFAAARPQFGEEQVRAEQKGIDLVIVLDVSSSMLATDDEPSRLGRAQTEIDAMLDRMEGDRVGLLIFGRNTFVRSPLTSDLRALHGIVDSVARERALVRPGSDLGGAIRSAMSLVRTGHADTKALLIVSDGEDHGSSVAQAVADARKGNIRIYTAGAGTDSGAPVLDVNPTSGEITPRTDNTGKLVLTRRDEDALRTIAQNGDGRYVALDGDGRPLGGLAAEFDALATTTFGSAPAARMKDRFQVFAAIALLLVVAEFFLPALVRPRFSMTAALRLAPLVGAGLLVAAVCTATVADVNRRGNDAYTAGDFAGALTQYKTAEAMDPSRPELYHNAGNAYDQQGDYARAIDETKRAPEASSTDVAARLQYALGNHYVGAVQLLDAIEAYKRALLADPGDADAKHNLELAIARLTPSPTPTATQRPTEGTATPSGTSTPNSEQQGTPEAGEGTPSASGRTPHSDEQPLTDEELQQALDEALRGLDRNFTEEEAQRVLDLLNRKNQQTVENLANNAASGGLPDY
jgi:Ca-activated chloride channel family protein